MRKILFITSLLFLLNCSPKKPKSPVSLKSIADTQSMTFVEPLKIPTDSISKISYLNFQKANTFYTVDPFKNKIFRCQLSDSIQIDQIGQRGQGPGEYIKPFKLHIDNHQIFYNDFSYRIIKGYDLKTKEEMLKLQNNGTAFMKYQNYFFVKNMLIPIGGNNQDNHLLSIYDMKTEKLIKKAFNIDEQYSWLVTGLSGDIAYDDKNGRLYIVNNAPYKIFCMDTTLSVQPAINMEQQNPPGFISSDKKINNIKEIVKNSRGRTKPTEIINTFHKIFSLDMIYAEQTSFLLVGLRKGHGELLYHIIDTDGNFIDYFTCEQQSEYVCGVQNFYL